MATVSVQVDGLRQLTRGLEQAGADLDDLKDVFGGIAAEAARVGGGFTPRATGNLANTVRGNRAKNKAVVTWGRGRVNYAGPVLFGPTGTRGAQTINQTDDVMADRAPEMLEAGLADVFRKAGIE